MDVLIFLALFIILINVLMKDSTGVGILGATFASIGAVIEGEPYVYNPHINYYSNEKVSKWRTDDEFLGHVLLPGEIHYDVFFREYDSMNIPSKWRIDPPTDKDVIKTLIFEPVKLDDRFLEDHPDESFRYLEVYKKPDGTIYAWPATRALNYLFSVNDFFDIGRNSLDKWYFHSPCTDYDRKLNPEYFRTHRHRSLHYFRGYYKDGVYYDSAIGSSIHPRDYPPTKKYIVYDTYPEDLRHFYDIDFGFNINVDREEEIVELSKHVDQRLGINFNRCQLDRVSPMILEAVDVPVFYKDQTGYEKYRSVNYHDGDSAYDRCMKTSRFCDDKEEAIKIYKPKTTTLYFFKEKGELKYYPVNFERRRRLPLGSSYNKVVAERMKQNNK